MKIYTWLSYDLDQDLLISTTTSNIDMARWDYDLSIYWLRNKKDIRSLAYVQVIKELGIVESEEVRA